MLRILSTNVVACFLTSDASSRANFALLRLQLTSSRDERPDKYSAAEFSKLLKLFSNAQTTFPREELLVTCFACKLSGLAIGDIFIKLLH